MGWGCPPYYGKSKFYEKKKAKIEKKIENLKAELKVCEEEIAKANDEQKKD